uniref:pseudouridine synthase n=1 Tax=Sphingomonas sp. Leaf24 TaxID=1735690 RepID=UPI0009EB03DD|nr:MULTISPECIES: pseudouridine synthase [unclassified Sphingomonas]
MHTAYTNPQTREGDEGTASAETFVASPQTETLTIVTPPESTTESPREGQRIAKLLARAGVASRRDVERMIAAGRVALDGVVLETPATILPNLKGVTVDGAPVAAPEPTRLFRFHKPAGTLTAERDGAGRETIYDRLPKGLPRLIPVGRLDLNTEGLLLMTTDGEFKRRLELPATGVERTYRARAYGEISQQQLEDLMMGIEIEGVRYGPINANLERRTGTNTWIEMTLTEGKNREVRRVLEHLGLKVSRLIRTRYGPFYLEDLPEGEVDEIKQHELVAFRKTLTNKPTSKPAPEGADPAALKAWRRATPLPRPEPVATSRFDERRPRTERDGQRSGFSGRRPDRDGPNRAQGDGERRSFGARPQGDGERHSFGARPQGDGERRSFDARPQGDGERRSFGARPQGDGERRSFGARPQGDGERRSFGARPQADGERRSFGARPQGDGERRSFGARPQADGERRSFGARPQADGERRSFGARPQGDGERRSFGARPQGGGDRPGFGDRPQRADARRVGPRTHATERPVDRRDGFDPLAQAGQTPAERRQPGLGDRRAYGDRPDNARTRRASAHAERPGYDGVARRPQVERTTEGPRGPVEKRMTREQASDVDRASFVERPKRKPTGWAKATPTTKPVKGKPKGGGRPGGGKR